jgi:hypothetical protein
MYTNAKTTPKGNNDFTINDIIYCINDVFYVLYY